jgi:hypothetical protein
MKSDFITIVSGLPRSGTSLMMQMLAAGGLQALTDGVRWPDMDNPRGYHEWEPVKRLREAPGCIVEAEGKAVKVISSLLAALPARHSYRVLFMQRPLEEIQASQAAMIRRLGTAGPSMSEAELAAALRAHLAQVRGWLERQAHMKVAWVDYHGLLARPLEESARLRAFLGLSLNEARMAESVDPSLYRQKQAAGASVAPSAAALVGGA